MSNIIGKSGFPDFSALVRKEPKYVNTDFSALIKRDNTECENNTTANVDPSPKADDAPDPLRQVLPQEGHILNDANGNGNAVNSSVPSVINHYYINNNIYGTPSTPPDGGIHENIMSLISSQGSHRSFDRNDCIRRLTLYFHFEVFEEDKLYVFLNGQYVLVTEESMSLLFAEVCNRWYGEWLTSSQLSSLYSSIFSAVRSGHKHIARNEDVVAFEDGHYYYRTLEKAPASMDFMPNCFLNARLFGEGDECPKFESYLWDVTGGDPVLTQRIWEVLGYLLSGYSMGKHIFVFQGVKDSGKTVLSNLLADLFRDEDFVSIDVSELTNRHMTAAIIDPKVALLADISAAPLGDSAVAMLKRLSGGDKLSVNPKYKAHTTARSRCRFLVTTNHPILTKTDDDAFVDRLVCIPFRYRAIDKNVYLSRELKEERHAIARKALSYFPAYYERQQFVGDYPVNAMFEDGAKEKDKPLSFQEAVAAFLEKYCVLSTELQTYSADLHNAFTAHFPAFRSVHAKEPAQEIRRTHPSEVSSRRWRSGVRNLWGLVGIGLKVTEHTDFNACEKSYKIKEYNELLSESGD